MKGEVAVEVRNEVRHRNAVAAFDVEAPNVLDREIDRTAQDARDRPSDRIANDICAQIGPAAVEAGVDDLLSGDRLNCALHIDVPPVDGRGETFEERRRENEPDPGGVGLFRFEIWVTGND